MDDHTLNRQTPEPLYTLKDAAKHFRVPYYKVQRAVKRGLIPTCFFNSRQLVRLSDIEMAIKRASSNR